MHDRYSGSTQSPWTVSQRMHNREKLQQAQKAELDIRRDKQRLEDEKAEFELTVNRRADDERAGH